LSSTELHSGRGAKSEGLELIGFMLEI
jgi:hypothetical protein